MCLPGSPQLPVQTSVADEGGGVPAGDAVRLPLLGGHGEDHGLGRRGPGGAVLLRSLGPRGGGRGPDLLLAPLPLEGVKLLAELGAGGHARQLRRGQPRAAPQLGRRGVPVVENRGNLLLSIGTGSHLPGMMN